MVFLNNRVINSLLDLLCYQTALYDSLDAEWRANRNICLETIIFERGGLAQTSGHTRLDVLARYQPHSHSMVVDIFEYYLAEVACHSPLKPESYLIGGWLKDYPSIEFRGNHYCFSELDWLELITLLCVMAADDCLSWPLFRAVADGVGIDFEEIYKLYTARRGVDCFLNKTPLW